MAEEKVFKLDLGDRVVELNGNKFTGKFETTDEKMYEALFAEFKKPEIYLLDLKNNVMNLDKVSLKGKVAFKVSEWNEKLKKHVPNEENIAKFKEISYRLSLIEQNEQREKTKFPYKSNTMLRKIEDGGTLDNVTYISMNDHPGLIPESERNF